MAAGLDHGHFFGPVNLLFDADPAVETDEVGAAAEEDVLAVVDDFVDAGMQIGRGASAEVAAALDELHAVAGFGESAGCAHAGYAASNDGDDAWSELFWRRVQVFLGLGFKEKNQKADPSLRLPHDRFSFVGPQAAPLRMTPFYSGTPGSG